MTVGVVAATGVCAAVLPASAAEQSVVAGANDTNFQPATLTIRVGDTVTFKHAAGPFPHNVHFDDDSFDKPAEPTGDAWSNPRTFETAGTFRYYCDFHGAPGGQGMAGKIVVLEAGAPLPDTTKPVLGGVAPQAKTFGATKPARILFGLSEPATVTGVLARRRTGSRGAFSTFGTVRKAAKKGANTLDVTRTQRGRRLTPGSYRLTLVATDAAKNRSTARIARFSVRSK